MAVDGRCVEFGKPARAVHIKLTGPLFEALLNARNSGEKVVMDVGGTNAITVGEQQFKFQAHNVGLQDIVRIPTDRSKPCAEVATVTQRLHVQRVMTDAERERVRLRGQEAETLRKGRTAQVLVKAPLPSKGRKVVSRTVARSATPPAAVQKAMTQRTPGRSPQRMPTPPTSRNPTPPPGMATPAPSGRNPTPQPSAKPQPPAKGAGAAAATARLTPPPGAAKARLGLSRLGKAKRPPSASQGTLVAAPPLAIEAARRNLGLRKVLIACIGNERPKKPKLDQMLGDVARRVAGFKADREEATRVLKDIAEFRAPGVYLLTDYTQRKELLPLQQELGSPPASEAPSRTPSVELEAAIGAHREAQPKPAATAGRSFSPMVAKKRKTSPDVPGAAAQEKEAKHANKKQRREKDGQIVRKSVKAKADKPKAEEPKAEREPETAQVRPTEEARPATGVPQSEWWFREFVRSPCLGQLPPMNSKEEFDALYDRHDEMYEAYTRLGREINRFKSEYLAMTAAAGREDSQEKAAALDAKAKGFYQERIEEVRGMNTAFQTLHSELEEVKSALGAFCDTHLAREQRTGREALAAGT